MSKVLRAVGQVAGVVAAVAAFIPGGQPIAAIAAGVSAIANVGAALTAKPPRQRAQGTLNETTIGANQAMPYLIGETYSGGAIVHEAGYGATLKKVKNPYYFRAATFSFCGPVAALVGFYADFEQISLSGNAATGFYSGFMFVDQQLGETPESSALSRQWAGCPNWSDSHRLSGHAALGISLLFDKEGERFASGQPQFGAVWQGVKVYDPRLDSTYPGGSGSCRINDESTWVYSERPALHALSYAYGRYQNGVKVFGVDLGDAAIDIAGAVAWANLCDANDWKVGGTIYEPGDKWNNLKLVCQAGGCEPVLAGGFLRWRWQKPHVSLRTITPDDLANPDLEVPSNQTWKARRNTIIPRYRSSAHKWEYVQSDPVTRSQWLAEDGEEKAFEQEFTLVQQKDQAAQLGAYQVAEDRGAGSITLVLKPEFMTYDPGDGLTIDIPEAGLEMVPVIITSRTVAPDTGEVTLTFMTREPDVDEWALAQTGTAPPPTPIVSAQDRDEAAGNNNKPIGYDQELIRTSNVTGRTVTFTDTTSDITVEVSAHSRVYADKTVAIEAKTIPGIPYGAVRYVYYDDPGRAGGAVSIAVTDSAAIAYWSADNPDRHVLVAISAPDGAGGGGSGGGGTPPGWDGIGQVP